MTLRTVLITGFETAPELAEVTSLTAHQCQARIYLLAGESFGDRRGVARDLFPRGRTARHGLWYSTSRRVMSASRLQVRCGLG